MHQGEEHKPSRPKSHYKASHNPPRPSSSPLLRLLFLYKLLHHNRRIRVLTLRDASRFQAPRVKIKAPAIRLHTNHELITLTFQHSRQVNPSEHQRINMFKAF
ncbi:unnamed protein product [Brassica rapa subsp. trilocularis]